MPELLRRDVRLLGELLGQVLREYGGDLKLVGLSPYLRHIFDLAGASPQFDFCRTEEEASDRFSGVRVAA